MIVDYLTFRIIDVTDDDFQNLLSLIGLSPGEFEKYKGRYYFRYVDCWSWNDIIFIYWNEERDEVLVKFTGQGIDVVYKNNGISDRSIINNEFNLLSSLFHYFSSKIKFTRIDIAIDTTDEKTVNKVLSAIASGDYTSVSKTRSVYTTYKSNKLSGYTVYIGSRSSDRMMRIYDKAAEQGIDDFLFRFEIEFKKDWADLVANLVANEKTEEILSLFNDMLTIRERSNDTNKSRWKVATFWMQFIRTSLRKVVKLRRPKRNVFNFVWYVRENLMLRLREALEVDKKLLDDIKGVVIPDNRKLIINNAFVLESFYSSDIVDF